MAISPWHEAFHQREVAAPPVVPVVELETPSSARTDSSVLSLSEFSVRLARSSQVPQASHHRSCRPHCALRMAPANQSRGDVISRDPVPRLYGADAPIVFARTYDPLLANGDKHAMHARSAPCRALRKESYAGRSDIQEEVRSTQVTSHADCLPTVRSSTAAANACSTTRVNRPVRAPMIGAQSTTSSSMAPIWLHSIPQLDAVVNPGVPAFRGAGAAAFIDALGSPGAAVHQRIYAGTPGRS